MRRTILKRRSANLTEQYLDFVAIDRASREIICLTKLFTGRTKPLVRPLAYLVLGPSRDAGSITT
jgi:hypothetical protein